MPKTRSKSPPKKQENVRLTQGQLDDLDRIVKSERYGTSRPEVIRYFLMKGLQEFDLGGKLDDRSPPTGDKQG